MVGPVYALEWLQASRRVSRIPWRWLYAIALFLEVQWLTINLIEYLLTRDPGRLTVVTEALLYLIAAQQTVAILIVAPAFAAGSISDEKRRGTLDFLLTTPLHAVEIVLGKWLGQATRVLHLLSPGFFLQVLLAGTVGELARPVFLPILEQFALTYAVTALSLLASIWCRSTARAILSVYAVLASVVVAEWFLDVPVLGASLWATPLRVEISPALRWAGIGALALGTLVCLALAAWRLRPAHERQKSAGPSVLSRWWDRPSMGDTPMRWKERFIGDWMSVPYWSAAPRWLRYTLIAGAVAACLLAWPRWETFVVLGSVQVIFSGLFVAVRAAGSVTGEREKQTWDSLLVTRMDAHQLLRGKLWGHIDAARPYMLTYLSALLLVGWTEPLSLVGAVYAWLASWILFYYLGAVGIAASVSASSTWRSILVTLVRGLWWTTLLLGGTSCGLFAFSIGIVSAQGTNSWLHLLAAAIIAPVPGLLWLLALAEERLHVAEVFVSQNSRENIS